MSDTFSDSARRGAAVTPSDTTVVQCNAVYVGGAGNLAVQFYDGGPTVTLTAIAVGVVHRIAAYRIMAATTATAIVALY